MNQCYLNALFTHSVQWFHYVMRRILMSVHIALSLQFELHMHGSNVMTVSPEKKQTLLIFCAIWENTVSEQGVCLKADTVFSAVFTHITLEWTPFAYFTHWDPWPSALIQRSDSRKKCLQNFMNIGWNWLINLWKSPSSTNGIVP